MQSNSTTPLSELHVKIIESIAAGERTLKIAGKLYLSRQGVEYHVSKLLQQLRVPNRPALVAKAYSMGILLPGTWPPEAPRTDGRIPPPRLERFTVP
ncbi:LuxR C-terminal-related transcriptional regulator [Streptosporangium sp. NPDC000509]|uniref:LuxR C-terminal-related transcriptional regulator n=1 Tax=Streptosporangium sp. NPDC000509 TaxID=3366186 RepID=UPI0036A72D53